MQTNLGTWYLNHWLLSLFYKILIQWMIWLNGASLVGFPLSLLSRGNKDYWFREVVSINTENAAVPWQNSAKDWWKIHHYWACVGGHIVMAADSTCSSHCSSHYPAIYSITIYFHNLPQKTFFSQRFTNTYVSHLVVFQNIDPLTTCSLPFELNEWWISSFVIIYKPNIQTKEEEIIHPKQYLN